MKKTILFVMILSSILYSNNDIILLDAKKDSTVSKILISGNGEECKVTMDSSGKVLKTTCLQLTNSKNTKILCTKKKKICKTVTEINIVRLLKKGVFNDLIANVTRDLGDESKLLAMRANKQEQTVSGECKKPKIPDDINASKLTIEEQSDILWKSTDEWHTYENCVSSKIETAKNVEELYNLITDANETCNPGYFYIFNEWSTLVTSERTMYSVSTNCNTIYVGRKLFFLDKVFSSKNFNVITKNNSLSQKKWEEYIRLECATGEGTNINNSIMNQNLHPAEESEIWFCLNTLISERVIRVYEHTCERNGVEPCTNLTF